MKFFFFFAHRVEKYVCMVAVGFIGWLFIGLSFFHAINFLRGQLYEGAFMGKEMPCNFQNWPASLLGGWSLGAIGRQKWEIWFFQS